MPTLQLGRWCLYMVSYAVESSAAGMGLVLGFQAASKRWSVRIAGEPKAMAVLPQNLTPVVQRGVDTLPAGGAV